MSEPDGKIPDVTLETLCRTFYKQSSQYGFTHIDYVRYVNLLLDMAMQGRAKAAVADAQPKADSGVDASRGNGEMTELPLEGDGFNVRQFEPEADLPLFDKWLSDPWGRYFLLSRITTERQDIRDVAGSDTSLLGIITLPDTTPVGAVAFLDHDLVQRKAELRKIIGDPEQRGKGIATKASALWIRYGQYVLGLKKIYVNTLNTNINNIRLNEDLGFKVEGVLRNEVFIDGTYHDVLRMGLWME